MFTFLNHEKQKMNLLQYVLHLKEMWLIVHCGWENPADGTDVARPKTASSLTYCLFSSILPIFEILSIIAKPYRAEVPHDDYRFLFCRIHISLRKMRLFQAWQRSLDHPFPQSSERLLQSSFLRPRRLRKGVLLLILFLAVLAVSWGR